MIPFSENLAVLFQRLWNYLIELSVSGRYHRRVRNRSLVRIIGSILPLPPAPRVYFNLAAWNPEVERFTDETGCEVVSPKTRCEVVSTTIHEGVNYQQQIDLLQDELKTIKDKLALLLEKETTIRLEKLSKSMDESKIEKGKSSIPVRPPPPPPPPPPPMPNFDSIASKPPQFKKNKRSTPRSPGGRPIKVKKEPEIDPNDILAQVLKKRYSVIQESSESESFNTSFTELTSPVKSAAY